MVYRRMELLSYDFCLIFSIQRVKERVTEEGHDIPPMSLRENMIRVLPIYLVLCELSTIGIYMTIREAIVR